MKTTIDIPDDLYRMVKAKSALEGRAVREVTIELYKEWLAEPPQPGSVDTKLERLEAWFEMADEAMKDAPSGPTARDMIEEDRNRLERK
jgi:hypothetical protein